MIFVKSVRGLFVVYLFIARCAKSKRNINKELVYVEQKPECAQCMSFLGHKGPLNLFWYTEGGGGGGGWDLIKFAIWRHHKTQW